jgi:hypothetical protein
VSIALAPCLEKKNRILRWTKECYKRKPKHKRKSHDRLNVEETKTLQNIFRFDGTSFDGLLKIVTATTAKRNTREKQSLTISVYPLRCVIWPQEILLKTQNSKCYISINWKFVLEIMLLLGSKKVVE